MSIILKEAIEHSLGGKEVSIWCRYFDTQSVLFSDGEGRSYCDSCLMQAHNGYLSDEENAVLRKDFEELHTIHGSLTLNEEKVGFIVQVSFDDGSQSISTKIPPFVVKKYYEIGDKAIIKYLYRNVGKFKSFKILNESLLNEQFWGPCPKCGRMTYSKDTPGSLCDSCERKRQDETNPEGEAPFEEKIPKDDKKISEARRFAAEGFDTPLDCYNNDEDEVYSGYLIYDPISSRTDRSLMKKQWICSRCEMDSSDPSFEKLHNFQWPIKTLNEAEKTKDKEDKFEVLKHIRMPSPPQKGHTIKDKKQYDRKREKKVTLDEAIEMMKSGIEVGEDSRRIKCGTESAHLSLEIDPLHENLTYRIYCSECGQKMWDSNLPWINNRIIEKRFLQKHEIKEELTEIRSLIREIIVKSGSQFCLKSHKKDKKGKRKNLGCYDSRKGAEDREKQVNAFKHMKK